MDFTIRIANTTILIHSVYPGLYVTYKNFLVEDIGIPDLEIRVDEDMIAAEYERFEQAGEQVPTLKMAESYLVQRRIAEELLSRDTILMHGAVVAADKACYMFTAPSGTGKTTHVQKWLVKHNNSFIVNGDKPLIRLTETQAIACGTPWCGKENQGENAMVPLKAIVLMERGEGNKMEEVTFGRAFPFLLQQTYRPSDPVKMKKSLTLLSKLNGRVRFYRFVFNNMKDDAFSVSYQALTGNNK